MADEGPTTVGSINAKLVLDADEFERKMREAAAQADHLDGKKIELDVKLEGTTEVNAALAELAAAQGKLASTGKDYAGTVAQIRLAESASTDTSKAAQQAAEKLATTKANLEKASNSYTIAELNLKKVEDDVNATEQQRLRAQNALITAGQQLDKATTAQQAAVKALTDAEKAGTDADNKAADAKKKAADAGQAQFTVMQGILAASPLLIGATDSLAAATVGLGLGFVGMGAAGVLAVLGIKNEMAAGTQVGQAYSDGLNTLHGDLDRLSQTSATAMLGSFNTAVGDINSSMPYLNTLMGEMSSALGNVAGGVLQAVVSGLQTAQPLIESGAEGLAHFVGYLDAFASSQGFQQFIGYAVANMPSVVTLLENLVTTAGHLLEAFAPVGPVVITLLNDVTGALNALPLPVLAALSTGAIAAGLAFKLMGSGAVLGALRSLATSIGLVASAQDLLIPGIGAAAAAIGLLVDQTISASSSQQDLTQASQTYMDVLKQSNGVIDDNVRHKVALQLVNDGAGAAAQRLGVNLDTLTSAATGNTGAQKQLNDQLDKAKAKLAEAGAHGVVAGSSMQQLKGDVNTLTSAFAKQSGGLADAVANYKLLDGYTKESAGTTEAAAQAQAQQALALQNLATQYGVTTTAIQNAQKATGDTNGTISLQSAALDAVAQKYGVTTNSVYNAITAQQLAGGTLNATTLQMQLQNDAGGLLKQTLDALNGKTISAADAQNAFDSQLANMGTHVDATGKAIQFTTSNIGNMSAASVALRGQLNSQVTDLENVAEANRNNGMSTEDTRQKMIQMRQQIIDNAVAHGVDRDAVTKYVDSLLTIPKSIPPTQLEADASAGYATIANFKEQLSSIPAVRAVQLITINDQINNTSTSDTGTNVSNSGAPQARALGGTIGYFAGGGNPFARGTDTVPAMLTPGEMVIKRSSADAMRRDYPGALEHINATGRLPQTGGTGPVTVQVMPSKVTLVAGGQEFEAYIDFRADARIGSAVRSAVAMRPGM